MSSYKGHLVGGAIAYALLMPIMRGYSTSGTQALCWFGVTLLGALFPDVDTKSMGQKVFYAGGLVFLLWCAFSERWPVFVATSFLMILPILANHRGIFHSIFF